jgi:hypothetical protein
MNSCSCNATVKSHRAAVWKKRGVNGLVVRAMLFHDKTKHTLWAAGFTHDQEYFIRRDEQEPVVAQGRLEGMQTGAPGYEMELVKWCKARVMDRGSGVVDDERALYVDNGPWEMKKEVRIEDEGDEIVMSGYEQQQVVQRLHERLTVLNAKFPRRADHDTMVLGYEVLAVEGTEEPDEDEDKDEDEDEDEDEPGRKWSKVKSQEEYDDQSRGTIPGSREGSGRFMTVSAVAINRSTEAQRRVEKVELGSQLHRLLDWTELVIKNACCYSDEGIGLSARCRNRGSNSGIDGLRKMFGGRRHVMNVSFEEFMYCVDCSYALFICLAVELTQLARLRLACSMQLHTEEMEEMMMMLGRMAVGKFKIEVHLQICAPPAQFKSLIRRANLSEWSTQFGVMPLEVPGSSGMINCLTEEQKVEGYNGLLRRGQEYREWLEMVKGREMIWQMIVNRYNRSYEAPNYHE